MLGGTGSGKSTFCHLITGSDPRINTEKFKTSSKDHSCTQEISMEQGLEWFDKEGKLTLIDVPGLWDSQGGD